MIPALNDLHIVELSCFIFHEAHDPARLARVREEIAYDAVQRNPVIVSPYGDRYLLLDGAHRARALGELGCRFALVQLVELPEKAGSWGHLLDHVGLEEALHSVEEVEVSETEPEQGYLAEARFSGGGKLFTRAREEGIVPAVRALWALRKAAWCARWTPIDSSGGLLERRCSSTGASRLKSSQRASRRGRCCPRALPASSSKNAS